VRNLARALFVHHEHFFTFLHEDGVHTASPSRRTRWKATYGGMELNEKQRLKQVENENRRLNQIVAEQTFDIQALKAVVAKLSAMGGIVNRTMRIHLTETATST